ncbi:SDR family NAD(P)-dependent oxidoreductase [Novosphingobium sp.]|uniref:SDR family NAD(P)-dependent oxidoreductase n=1 Tax=Novosphingobium sp. TaxID=1874826 RepID=UPI0031D40AEB
MRVMMIFGMGYTGSAIATALRAQGWLVDGTGTHGTMHFDDTYRVHRALAQATAVISTAPPAQGEDPVLSRYGAVLHSPWLGYISSTGVYGDAGGAWVDESAPVGTGRRAARVSAEAQWLERGAHAFRLPGIYGPGRSAFDRLREGRAHRLDLPGQVFSRVHVADIVSAVLLAMETEAAPGPWNIADDLPCHQNDVIEEAARLMGVEAPPVVALDDPSLSEASRGFYRENRRVANGKAQRELGWRPAFPSYREGLRSVWEAEGRK